MTAIVLIATMLTGQASRPSTELESRVTVEAREAIELARGEVAKYSFYLDEARETKLQLRDEPILRWTNHLGRRFYGDVFIWTHQGRPEAVATITNCYGKSHAMELEAHSLSLTKFNALRDGQPMWHPASAGIELVQFPDAPAVADLPAQRLQQMRSLARRFAAISSPGPRQSQLRLLSQPVYRYTNTAPAVIDGAMFAFANGTDPDVFLLIEARRSGNATAWQYALARFNGHVTLQVSYNAKHVWTVTRLPASSAGNPNSPYFAFQRRFPEASEQEPE